MKKTWTYKGVNYTIERTHGYGQYILNGYHFTESSVWDDVDDEDNPKKQKQAKRDAECFLHTKSY